ncbi:MAG: ABC transporter permease [Planctomycetota bacterium]|jgi:ABC-type lipoprotein release transport system permease subunit
MKFPWAYPWRSLLVRWQASLFSAVGIAMTVAVLCGVFALRQGFQDLTSATGDDDVIVYVRRGSTSEGESGIPLERVEILTKSRPETALDEEGRPLAAGESYLALFLPRAGGGGEVNVPVRGIQEASLRIHGEKFRIVAGRPLTFGADEVMVGRPISERIANCGLDEVLTINVTPFEVVGIFEYEGAYRSEIWGDVERISAALDRPFRQRVLARLADGYTAEAVAAELDDDKRTPANVMSEKAYFISQTAVLGGVLGGLGVFLTLVLGIAAILGAANTMLAAVGARMREVGILRSMGFGRTAILLAFLMEAALIGLFGGILGALLVLPLDGIETGTMNWDTFTESVFAFRVNASLLLVAVGLAVGLGLVGGIVPAWRASRLRPVDALRRA